METKSGIGKIASGVLFFLSLISIVYYLLLQGYFFEGVLHWINKFSEPIAARLGFSVLFISLFCLLLVKSPVKINIGVISTEPLDLRELLKQLLPTPVLVLLTLISLGYLFLFPPKCNTPTVSIAFDNESGETEIIDPGDSLPMTYYQSVILSAISENDEMIICSWYSTSNAVAIDNSSECKTRISLSKTEIENVIINLRAENSCKQYYLFPIQIIPRGE